MALVEKSIALPSGVGLRYVEQGDPSGIPMLLLHGGTDSWRSFELVLPHLPPWIHAFALTQRGHGDSDRPADGYRARDFAADFAQFLDRLDLGPAIVVGHSMGSANAQRFAIDHPARTRGLVLVAAFAGYRENPVLVEFCGSVAALTDPIDASFARDFQQSTLARPVPPAFFEMVVQESLKLPARVWRTLFTTFLDDDFAAGRHRIAAPTLIVWGTRDAFCPRGDQVVLSSEIAGSRLVVYEGAGHAVHWEEPERFASDLMAFASGLRA